MKLKHVAMIVATLFLPACSNNTPKTDTEQIEVQRTRNVTDTTSEYNDSSQQVENNGIINDKEEVRKIETEFELNDTSNTLVEQQSSPTLLSTFSTKVYTKTNARMNNLNIVCEKISGVIINPGEEFSYNDIAGPYDKEHGFGKATVLMGDGSEVQGYGGGVCQVSSTLYNAVKDCGVEITERHNHSKDVYYVPRNQDATVSYGSLDFRFKNLNDYPIQIQASANKQNVTVEIYKA